MTFRHYFYYSLYLLLILFTINSLQAKSQYAKNIYIAENDGVVYSHDGGKTFDEYEPETTGIIDAPVYSIFVTGNTIYAGTVEGLSISYDGGQHFMSRLTKDTMGGNVINSIYAHGKMVYVGTENGLAISDNGGKTFINHTVKKDSLGNASIGAVYVDKQGRIYVTTALKGPLYISDNGGETFHRVPIKLTSKPMILSNPYSGGGLAVVGHTIYVVTGNGLYISYNNGKTLVPSRISKNVISIYAKGDNVYIVLDKSILISHDGGKTFIRRKIPKDSIGGIMALGQDIYGVGGCGYVVSRDDGKTFEHKMNNYQFKITSITPCIERYNATNDVFLTR